MSCPRFAGRALSGDLCRLEPTGESHLWKVSSSEEKCQNAFVGVYVDDREGICGRRSHGPAQWQVQIGTGGVDWTGHTAVLLRLSDWHSEGWRLLSEPGEVHQGDREARQIKGGETHPVPKIMEGEDEENPKGETVRTVQGVVGEMLWLSTRTRPDGCYATALIARLVHRRPTYALQLCQHLLRYVASTASLGLHYDGGSANGTLLVLVDTALGRHMKATGVSMVWQF